MVEIMNGVAPEAFVHSLWHFASKHRTEEQREMLKGENGSPSGRKNLLDMHRRGERKLTCLLFFSGGILSSFHFPLHPVLDTSLGIF